ncbi:MAG: hypothetical protein ACI9XR_002559, partial [Flavobacterium sp.]
MEKRILSFLFSTRLMAVLFIGYAVAMAVGTFIENEYNTDTARMIIYNTKWFEAIHVFFLINFFGNIKRYQLYKKEKWATLLLHLSFIFILIGAAVTRYISFEGMMPIKEGETTNQFFSEKNYITFFVDGEYKGEMKRKTIEKPLILSQAANSDFSISDKFDDTSYEVNYKNFVMDVKETIKQTPNGKYYLKMVESGDGERHEHYLVEGEVQNIHNVLMALNKPTPGAINIITDGKNTTLEAPFEGTFMRMIDKFQGNVAKSETQNLMFRSLYNLGGAQFVFPDQPIKGEKDYISGGDYKNKKSEDALTVTISAKGETKEVTLVGSKGKQGEPKVVKVGGLEFTLFFGSKVYTLPFSIKLKDFVANKYPGTENSYSSYESKVVL